MSVRTFRNWMRAACDYGVGQADEMIGGDPFTASAEDLNRALDRMRTTDREVLARFSGSMSWILDRLMLVETARMRVAFSKPGTELQVCDEICRIVFVEEVSDG